MGGGEGGSVCFILSNYCNNLKDNRHANHATKEEEKEDGIFKYSKHQGDYPPGESNIK